MVLTSKPMKIILLTAQIITLEEGKPRHVRSEVISQHCASDAPADAVVQDLAMRLARAMRLANLAKRQGVRQPKPDHSHIDD